MWTRLAGTHLWDVAEAAHASPDGRHYHVFAHPLRLYEIAAELDLPYCADLDRAILFHDAIYRGREDDVEESARLLLAQDPTATKAAWLVRTTQDHTPCRDNRLILLDLHDLGDLEISLENRELLIAEFEALKGVSREDFLAGNAGFMRNMVARIVEGVRSPEVHRDDLPRFGRIVQGIRALLAQVPEADSPRM